jgi:hypothetical protein
MSVALAMTWNPRGETDRFRRFYPMFSRWYAGVSVVLPPDPDPEGLAMLATFPDIQVLTRGDWVAGRQLTLELALTFSCDAVHYVDCDRLLRWFELHPDELRWTVQALYTADCLVIGRTAQAFATHPLCLQQTESMTNEVFSHLLGHTLDLASGSKGFSRSAAEYLVRSSRPSQGWCTDAEWIVLLQRAGFSIGSLLVNGLDWETADRCRDQAADAETQRRAAEAYDLEPKNWEGRTRLAQETIQAGLEALKRPLEVLP